MTDSYYYRYDLIVLQSYQPIKTIKILFHYVYNYQSLRQ